jgi:AcrR family transcriptional regulator
MDSKNKNQNEGLRLRLLKTASEIISKEGLKKLTMRALSNQVGVSRTASYRHFDNKDALLFAIAEEGFKELTLRYQKINREKSLDSISRLQYIGLAYIEFAVRNPGTYRLMFGQEITQQQRSAELCSAARETFSEYLIAVKAFQDENNIESDDYYGLANFSWATVHGLATLLIDGQFQIFGDNHGEPTLLTDVKTKLVKSGSPMIAFSRKILTNFWNMILNGSSTR